MPRFFLHIDDGDGLQRDETGQDFPGGRIAAAEASKTAGELLHDETQTGGDRHRVEVTVEDAENAPVAVVRASISLTDKLD